MSAGAREMGLLDTMRAAGATLAEIVHVRSALFVVELREEVERRKQSLVLAALAAASLHLALVLITVLVAAIFWDTHRMSALAALAALYLGCGAGLLLVLRRNAAASPAAFAASLSELEQDLRELRAPR